MRAAAATETTFTDDRIALSPIMATDIGQFRRLSPPATINVDRALWLTPTATASEVIWNYPGSVDSPTEVPTEVIEHTVPSLIPRIFVGGMLLFAMAFFMSAGFWLTQWPLLQMGGVVAFFLGALGMAISMYMAKRHFSEG